MPRVGDKLSTQLWITLAQVTGLCVESTTAGLPASSLRKLSLCLYYPFTQTSGLFAQAMLPQLHQLSFRLSSISTRPITNTKLINKD